MKIEDGLHLVLSGGGGFDLSDAFDCNVFMIAAGDEWLVFDAGGGRDPDRFAEVLAGDGIDPGSVRHLFLTHGHADHSGGAAALRERFDLETHACAATAKMVEAGDEVGDQPRSRPSGPASIRPTIATAPVRSIWSSPRARRCNSGRSPSR